MEPHYCDICKVAFAGSCVDHLMAPPHGWTESDALDYLFPTTDDERAELDN